MMQATESGGDASSSAAGGAPKPRLIIRQLVTENFKSYAGVQVIGPFHTVRIPPCSGPIPGTSCGPLTRVGAQSFSSVVGPNGSGKSNVIDAVLFVFAKRAKQIRMNKVCACRRPVRVAPSPRSCLQVSELIHKSDEHRDYDFAKVDVHFAEVVDGVRLPIPLPARTGVRH